MRSRAADASGRLLLGHAMFWGAAGPRSPGGRRAGVSRYRSGRRTLRRSLQEAHAHGIPEVGSRGKPLRGRLLRVPGTAQAAGVPFADARRADRSTTPARRLPISDTRSCHGPLAAPQIGRRRLLSTCRRRRSCRGRRRHARPAPPDGYSVETRAGLRGVELIVGAAATSVWPLALGGIYAELPTTYVSHSHPPMRTSSRGSSSLRGAETTGERAASRSTRAAAEVAAVVSRIAAAHPEIDRDQPAARAAGGRSRARRRIVLD
jgi:hypothetical protein